MGLFDLFKKKPTQSQQAEKDDFNPLDINSAIDYIKVQKPNASEQEVADIISRGRKFESSHSDQREPEKKAGKSAVFSALYFFLKSEKYSEIQANSFLFHTLFHTLF